MKNILYFLLLGLFMTQSIKCNSFMDKQNIPLLSEQELEAIPYITSLEDALKDPEKVYKFALTDANLKAFPEELFQLVNLQVLVLSFNKIDKIPENIDELPNLQFLSIIGNNLTTIPPNIGQLKHLHTLVLSENQIQSIPTNLFDLPELKKLNLSYNFVSEIPTTIGKAKKLKTLWLDVNKFQYIPNELTHLTQLENLRLSGYGDYSYGLRSKKYSKDVNQHLLELPENIGNIRSLKSVELKHTGIKKLPESFYKLFDLESLDLRGCTNIPEEEQKKIKYIFTGSSVLM